MDQSCVIVGAGMAGLTAAEFLQSKGWDVVVLDKGRHFGGRMATRNMGESRLDHGAQFFAALDARFQKAVERWKHEDWVTHWFTEGRFTETGHLRYRAEGGMNSLAGHLAQSLQVRTETKVGNILPIENGWQVVTEAAETFRAGTRLLMPPAPQSIALMRGWADQLSAEFVDALQPLSYDPCFTLLVIIEEASIDGRTLVLSPGYVRPDNGPIEWIADNMRKGVSGGAVALTIQARADSGYLFSLLPSGTAIAGDGLGGPNAEGAFLSGLAAAEWIAGAR